MNIKIEKQSDHYRADCKDFPGSPMVGIGRTPALAVAQLFWSAMFTDVFGCPCSSNDPNNWLHNIKRDDPIIVNGEMWKYPESYKNG